MGIDTIRILVAEDDPDVVVFIVDQLEHLGFQVTVTRDGIEALESVGKERFDLIILDIMMPRMDGFEVCRRLRAAEKNRNVPILMLTAKGQIRDEEKGLDVGADDYLTKPYDKSVLTARVRALLRRSPPPFFEVNSHINLSLNCHPNHKVNIRTSGCGSFHDVTKDLLGIDSATYIKQAEHTPRLAWRFNSETWGKRLYHEVFRTHPEILGNYNRAFGEVKREEKLHIQIETPREFLGIPFEFMYEPLDANGDYLVLRHPFFRSITGIRRQRNPISRRFLNHLWREKEALRVLLVASDVPSPSIPVVDREVEMLKTLLREVFTHQGIAIQPEVLHTDEASYARVKQELHRCKYHIFHYAGHSSFDIDSPEKSFLLFWEKSGRRGDKKRMPSSELQMLLKESETRFVYFSSCSSAAVGTADNYLDDDFLGIMDGVICAGVPATLGYRWPIIDPGAESLARKFYSSLAEHGRLDTALLYARREVAGTNRDDITWLSPVLILQ